MANKNLTRNWSLEAKLAYYSDRQQNGCLLWTSTKDKDGYGQLWHEGGQRRVAKLAWECANGPMPDGMMACHHCDTPPCIEPSHIFPGSNGDNVADMVSKGRQVAPRGEKNGHAILTESAVRKIKASTNRGVDLAAQYGISPQAICDIKKGRKWAHVDAPIPSPAA